MYCMLQKDIKLIYSVSLIVSVTQTHAGSAGWLHALFPVTVFAKKSKYTEACQEKSTLHHRTATSHNVSYTPQGILVFFIALPFSL